MAMRFISDLHLNHNNVLHFDKRPFKTIEEHNNFIVNQWNNVVKEDDEIYILGDVGFGGSSKIVSIISSLKGKKHLVIGNHDRKLLKNPDFKNLFETISEKKILTLDSKRITLNHEPITHYDCQFYGGEMYYGHVHNGKSWAAVLKEQELLASLEIPTLMYNVCVSCPYINYAPRTREEIKTGFVNWLKEGDVIFD